MTKTKKSLLVTLAASAALFVAGFMCTGFTTASAASADDVCNHAYEAQEVAATCTEQGYTLYTCVNCGDEKKDNYTEAKEHNYTETAVAATCTTAGYTLYSCADCGHTYTEQTAAANGHTFEVVVVPNTCTHKGYTVHFCTTCGYEYKDNYSDEIGHDYKTTEIAPTCTERGYTEHTCEVCGDVYFDNYIDALGHTHEAVITEPTCLGGGFTTYTCATCGDEYIADYTEPNGHAYTETVNAATCVTYGYTDHVCNDCGDRFVTDYVSPKGHKYLDVLVPATKDSLGYTRHICVDCNYSYLSDYVTSGDDGYIHEPEEPVIPDIHKHTYEIQTMDDSENYQLIVMRVCACGDVKNGYFNVTFTDEDGNVTESKETGNKIDYSTGHKYSIITKPSTCTESEHITYQCSVCGDRYETEGNYPSGHSYVSTVTVAPTCTTDGERKSVCEFCGDEYTTKIIANGHNYEITDTATKNGKTTRTYTCRECGHSFKQELGDQYEEVTNYVEYLFEQYEPYMWWVLLASAGVWSIVIGVMIAIAQKNEEKEKAKKMLINYVIGLVVIAVIVVACPFLIRGIAALVT